MNGIKPESSYSCSYQLLDLERFETTNLLFLYKASKSIIGCSRLSKVKEFGVIINRLWLGGY